MDAGDTAYSELYGPVILEAAWKHEDDAPRPDEEFNKWWTAKVKEMINPDMTYSDTRLGRIGKRLSRIFSITTGVGSGRGGCYSA